MSFTQYGVVKAAVAKDAVGMDVFTNRAARMGFGTASVAEDAEYRLERYTNDYWLMVTLFRNHWLARKIVERPAQDMTKAWPRLSCELDPKLMSKFDRTIQRTYIPLRVKKALTWARLFGGSGSLMVIDGHEDRLDEPLELDDVTPGSFKGLINFDRWSGITPKGQVAADVNSPQDYGCPEYYTVNGIDGPLFDIHHSRILRWCGPEVPQPEYQASMYWGISVLEICMEEMRKCDNMDWSILQLMFRAQILTQVNPELAQLLSGASASQQAALKFFQTMQAQNELLSNNSMLVLGKEGKLESHQYSFGGVAEIMAQKQMYLAGAADMPVSLLFGRTVTGLGQTGDADVRNYESKTSQGQQEEVRPNLDKLYPVICMSEFGEVPDDLDMVFPAVRVLTEEEKADLAQKGGQVINDMYSAGIISQKIAAKEHKQLSEKTEIGSNITDEFIDTLDEEVNVPLEIEANEARAGTEEFEEEATPKPAKGKDAFEESEHPRDEHGRFALSQKIAEKLGYKIVNHGSEESYAKTPGYKLGTSGYASSQHKEIHLNTSKLSTKAAGHYLHHEVGHILDYDHRKVDSFNKALVRFHKNSKELKNIANVFETNFNMKTDVLKYHKNSVGEVMAEAFAMYQERPEVLQKIAPKTYEEMKQHLASLLSSVSKDAAPEHNRTVLDNLKKALHAFFSYFGKFIDEEKNEAKDSATCAACDSGDCTTHGK